MNLIYIYGPPAAGKLTVAKELAKITNYKILHNHLTIDLIEPIFEFGTKPFLKLSSKFRLDLLKAAAKEDVSGIITTVCYAHKVNDSSIRRLIKALSPLGVNICFVHLACDMTELEQRVIEPSRNNFGKLTSVKKLRHVLSEWELTKPIPFVNNLFIDSTNLSAKSTALKIKKHFKL